MEKPRKKELLDCPFCGNKALTKIEQPRMDSDNVPKYCKCSYGPCCASKIYWPIEQWNVRAISTWLEVEVPTVEDIKEVLDSTIDASYMTAIDYRNHAEAKKRYENSSYKAAEAIHELIKRKLTGK